MLQLSLGVLVAAVIAAVLGFGGIVGAAVGIAQILFVAFVVLFLAAVIRERRPAR